MEALADVDLMAAAERLAPSPSRVPRSKLKSSLDSLLGPRLTCLTMYRPWFEKARNLPPKCSMCRKAISRHSNNQQTCSPKCAQRRKAKLQKERRTDARIEIRKHRVEILRLERML